MKNRHFCLFAVLLLLLSLCACRAMLPGESDTAAPTTKPTDASATAPTASLSAQIEVWREGELSRIPVQIVSGQCGSYTIAMDPAYFTFLPQKDGDLFSYEGWGSAQPVYYRVSSYRGPYDPDAFIGQCKQPQFRQTGTETLTLGGYPVSSITDLTRALRNFKAGDTTTVTVIRSGGELTLTITLDEKPQVTDTPATPEPEPDMPEQGEFEEWYDYFRRYFGE